LGNPFLDLFLQFILYLLLVQKSGDLLLGCLLGGGCSMLLKAAISEHGNNRNHHSENCKGHGKDGKTRGEPIIKLHVHDRLPELATQLLGHYQEVKDHAAAG
jgi:hypothetical protein